VLFLARDPQGRDVTDGVVSVDGVAIPHALEGSTVALDPGPHVVRFDNGGKTVESTVVLIQGEKNRRLEFTFVSSGASSRPIPAEEPPPARAPIPTATLVLGGVAVTAGTFFAVFALMGKSQESCAPNCSRSSVDTLRRDYVIADVSWIVGLAALGVGLVYWFVQPSPRRASSAHAHTGNAGGARVDGLRLRF
jgi:hypothetical protein